MYNYYLTQHFINPNFIYTVHLHAKNKKKCIINKNKNNNKNNYL